jgi:hypothetical protein
MLGRLRPMTSPPGRQCLENIKIIQLSRHSAYIAQKSAYSAEKVRGSGNVAVSYRAFFLPGFRRPILDAHWCWRDCRFYLLCADKSQPDLRRRAERVLCFPGNRRLRAGFPGGAEMHLDFDARRKQSRWHNHYWLCRGHSTGTRHEVLHNRGDMVGRCDVGNRNPDRTGIARQPKAPVHRESYLF